MSLLLLFLGGEVVVQLLSTYADSVAAVLVITYFLALGVDVGSFVISCSGCCRPAAAPRLTLLSTAGFPCCCCGRSARPLERAGT